MTVSVRTVTPAESGARAIAFVVFEEEAHGRAAALDGAKALLGVAPAAFFGRAGFKGDAERVLVHHRTEADGPARLIFVGGGSSARATEETFRRAAAHATKAAADVESLALVLRKGSVAPAIQAAAMVEGSLLARYRFDRFSSKPRKGANGVGDVAVLAWNAESASLAAEGCRTGEASAAACVLARDLANLPGNACRPSDLADAARQVAKKEGLRCEVLDGAAMKRLAMGSLLSVNGGSAAPPRLIVLEFGKKRAGQETICVIGKGVTFDSGGISIKPALDMDKMRYDKSGGCATIGLMVAVARLEPRAHVVGIVPACENMPGNDATRPGDVVRAMNGKTIEVLNTDAEGRLILADAICFARERFAPDRIIDIATLTGACAATFGSHAAGMLGTDAGLMRDLSKAGDATYERVWQLPLWEEYETMMRGSYGDLKNIGGPRAGTITAAAFLKQFAETTPWVHLDIAGTAYDDGRVYNQGAGATGAGARLLCRLLVDRYGAKRAARRAPRPGARRRVRGR
jgi:leucyl aminopeptidase